MKLTTNKGGIAGSAAVCAAWLETNQPSFARIGDAADDLEAVAAEYGITGHANDSGGWSDNAALAALLEVAEYLRIALVCEAVPNRLDVSWDGPDLADAREAVEPIYGEGRYEWRSWHGAATLARKLANAIADAARVEA